MRLLQAMAGARHGGAEAFFLRLALALNARGLEQRMVVRPHGEARAALAAAQVPTQAQRFGGWLDWRTRRALSTRDRPRSSVRRSTCCKGSRPMPELAARLRTMRAKLVDTMANELAADGDWHSWVPLLAQTELAIRAVEAVMEERAAPHLEDRAAFAIVSPDSPETQRAFAEGRGWPFRMASNGDSGFTAAMGFSSEKDGKTSHRPGYSTFAKQDDGSITRVGHDFFGPGDAYCSLWISAAATRTASSTFLVCARAA